MALLGANVSDKIETCFIKAITKLNPIMAQHDIVIAEAEEIVEIGEIAPESVRTQSIFVDYIVKQIK